MSTQFYMNVTLVSAEKMLDAKISAKIGKGYFKRAPVKTAMKSMAMKGATAMLTPSKIAVKLAPNMAKNMPQKLAAKGITATAEVKLVHGPLIVILVTVKEVDANVILEKLGEKNETAFVVGSCVLQCLPKEIVKKVQEEALAQKIATKLAESMGPGIEAQVAENGIEAVAQGMVPAKEGEFLLDHLNHITTYLKEDA